MAASINGPDTTVAELAAAQTRTEQRLEALARAVQELADAQRRTEQRLDELAQAQRRTEESLKSLIDVVSGMNDRVAKLDGWALEQRYRDKGHAYFQRVARRLHLIDGNALSPLVDDAREAGKLSERDAGSLMYADAVFSGRSQRDGTPVHLVVEASVTIGRHDVRRARERADLFARVVDTPVLAVVAGEFAPQSVAEAAQDADVWRVTNGNVVGPDEDLEP